MPRNSNNFQLTYIFVSSLHTAFVHFNAHIRMPRTIIASPGWFIDISWVDWAYKSSTCDVLYRRQGRHLYYGGQI
jgi:hypothetical protein